MRIIDESVFVEILENSDADICETYPGNYSEWGFSLSAIKDVLNRTPTITPSSLVKRGRWIFNSDQWAWNCSNCNGWIGSGKNMRPCKYCPNCGALMEG